MPELAITFRGVVYPWQCDHMGHMNVMYYVGSFDEATWALFSSVGITPTFLREQKRGMAAVSQKIAYKAELLPGDVITVRSGVLEVKPKALRFFHEMQNEEKGVVAAITELVAVHIDADMRKSIPFPEEIVQRAQRQVVPYDTGL